jgi:probable DNA metabolism protein
MSIYHYDSSFEGFLCAVSLCRECGDLHPEFVRTGAECEVGLFGGHLREVVTERVVAVELRRSFVAAVSQDVFATARYAFHSQKAGVEQLVWRYLQLGFTVGQKVALQLTEEPVYSVNRLARQVAHEAHKFKGFVRFQEVCFGDGGVDAETGSIVRSGEAASFLYARIEPEADVLPLIAAHFVERVGDRPWLIHDLRRKQAAVYDRRSWRLLRDIELTAEPHLSDAEHDYAALWQRYFQRHAIVERHNPKLQQKHVPLRYRKHLTEFGAGGEGQ